MSFLKGVSLTGITTLIVTFVAFFNNVIVTRQIGPDGRGKYVLISNIILFLTLVLGEGIRRTNTILIGNNKKDLPKLITQTIFFGLFLTIVFLLIFLLKDYWVYLIPNLSGKLILITLLAGLFVILWRAFQALFLGLEKMVEYNFLQLFTIVLTFLINVIGIYFFNFQLLEIVITILVSSLCTFILSVISLNSKISFKDFDIKLFREKSTSLTVKSTISGIENFITLKSNIYIINFFLTSAATGIFSIAILFTEVLQKFPNVAGPLIVSRSANKEYQNTHEITSQLFRVVLIMNIIVAILLFTFGEAIIVLLFGESFSQSYEVLLLLLPALIFYGPGTLIHAYFMGDGYPRFMLYINGGVALFCFVGNVIFVPQYGIAAAGIVSSVSYCLWTILYVYAYSVRISLPVMKIIIPTSRDVKIIYNRIFRGK